MATQQKRIPRLFDQFENQRTQREQRRYIEEEIVRMIEDGEFSLVAVMNQRPAVKQIANDVIFGTGITDGRDGRGEAKQQVLGLPIHQAIRKATVHIRSVDGQPIRYVDGAREVGDIIVGQTSRHAVLQQEENWIELSADERMGLREAWLAMKRFGKYVVWADTQQMRNDLWRYEEVEDEPKTEQPPEPRKSRRQEMSASL